VIRRGQNRSPGSLTSMSIFSGRRLRGTFRRNNGHSVQLPDEVWNHYGCRLPGSDDTARICLT
jgi:hypothetical protein